MKFSAFDLASSILKTLFLGESLKTNNPKIINTIPEIITKTSFFLLIFLLLSFFSAYLFR